MLEATNPVQSEMITAALDWWVNAGVDCIIDEVPVPWLERAKAAQPLPAQVATTAPKPVVLTEPVPKTLPAFVEWLATTASLPSCGPPAQRLVAAGDPHASLMVMIDMPEIADPAQGLLLSGDVGDLFEKMLSAIHQTRESIYLACFSPGRPAGGILSAPMLAQLTPLAWQHIDLIGPKRLWLMGQTVSRAIIGPDAAPGTGIKRKINHEGRNVESVASFSPSFLLANPKRKAAAWADMQALTEGNV
jgi:uracil-DNA glycosylase